MKPISYRRLERDLFAHREISLANDELYSSVEKLTSLAKPNLVFGENDKRWLYFYFPSFDKKAIFLVPFAIINYKDCYFLAFSGLNKSCDYFSTKVKIEKGRENEEEVELVKEIVDLAIKNYKKVYSNLEKIEKMVPVRFREGRIKSKYVYEPVLTKQEAKKIEELYLNHLKNCPGKKSVSLNDYLEVASIAIKSVYNVEGCPQELYEMYSDFRRGDILDINRDDPKCFKEWHTKNRNSDLHAYEIIAGYNHTGVVLIPPFENKDGRYILFSSPQFYQHLIKIALKFIENKIPFEFDYKNVLKHLTGENYIEVNTSNILSIRICDEKDPLVKKVKWKKLTLPKPK